MKIHVLLSSNMNGVDLFLLVRHLYNKQKNTCLLWDVEFLNATIFYETEIEKEFVIGT